MPIDPYAPCPGGTGKKVKFCCSDLTGELEKIQRMLDGDQRAACLDHIEGLQSKYPDRACLLSIKAMLEAELGSEAKAEATLARFREKFPDNPVALAEQAVMAARESAAEGVRLLQDALERCTNEIPPQVYDALGVVARALLTEGHVFAARAHLVLQFSMTRGKDEQLLQVIASLDASPQLPLLAKQELPTDPPPDDALWKTAYVTAMEPAKRGAFRLAATRLEELSAKVGEWPVICRNIAVLWTYLGDARAVEAWHKYAQQKIPLDDAIEAEALAQLLDTESVDLVDMVTITYEVTDSEKADARLAANQRSPRMPIDLARLGTPDDPPPKSAYWLLDKPIAASGKEIKLAEVSWIIGQVFLFGKQTDRAARLELSAYRPELTAAQNVAAEITGDAIGAAGAEEVDSPAPAVQYLLNANWQLPADTPPERRLALLHEHRNDVLANRWPELGQKALGGKTPREAAADPALRTRVLGALLLLELATESTRLEFDFAALRSKLGLAPADPIDSSSIDPHTLPLPRFTRVDVKTLSDEQLVFMLNRASHFRHTAALRALALEALERKTLEGRLNRAEIYGMLSQTEPDLNRAIGYLDEARKAAEAAKTSTASWDLAELAMRIARGEGAEVERLLQHIRAEHVREPGVAQALFQILAEAGIIGPDGRPTMPREQAGAAMGGPQPAAAAEPGKIWTPGSDAPAAAGKKSALWTPGMD